MSNMNLRVEACSCAPGMFLDGGSLAFNATAMNFTIGHTTPAAPRGA
jgi:hypothetical protein